MKSATNDHTNSAYILLDHHVLNLIGIPITITFTKTTAGHLKVFQDFWYVPDRRRFMYIEIHARTHTTRGIVDSKFCLASKIENNICTLCTTGHRDSALMKNEPIKFNNLLRAPKDTRNGGPELPKTLKSFHDWLATEIGNNLNNAGYFSSVHDCTEIERFNLVELSTLKKKRAKVVWGIAESD